MPATRRVIWYRDRIHAITTTIPNRAHDRAAQQAAGIGARKINSSYSGALARDVARAKKVAPGRSVAGSNKPYAAIENFGGTITAKSSKRLLIRGRRSGGRSTFKGAIVASATSVRHTGKHYLEAITAAYPGLFMANLRRSMPK